MTKQAQKVNPLIKRLEVLIGEWKAEASSMSFRQDRSETAQGHVSFKWLMKNAFIMQHSEFPDTEFPTAISMIGIDDTNEKYSILYTDSRGVSRIYEMSFENRTWKLWRTAPGFSQRFVGKFSDDNSIITAYWEKSEDGKNWERDFDLVYTRAK